MFIVDGEVNQSDKLGEVFLVLEIDSQLLVVVRRLRGYSLSLVDELADHEYCKLLER